MNNAWEASGDSLIGYLNSFSYNANCNILIKTRMGHAGRPNMDTQETRW